MISLQVYSFFSSYLSGLSQESAAALHTVFLARMRSLQVPSPLHTDVLMQLELGYVARQEYSTPTHLPLVQVSCFVHCLLSLHGTDGLLVHELLVFDEGS